jgi:CO dehydrogenase/acetyl-CoA synthase epsilon subunit
MGKTKFEKKLKEIMDRLEKLAKQAEINIVITPTSNGAVVKCGAAGVHEVFKFSADEENLDGAVDLFYQLKGLLADHGNRYAKQRLEIRIVHGDKYECKDKDCEICRKEA